MFFFIYFNFNIITNLVRLHASRQWSNLNYLNEIISMVWELKTYFNESIKDTKTYFVWIHVTYYIFAYLGKLSVFYVDRKYVVLDNVALFVH
jgi:hypothetical protein